MRGLSCNEGGREGVILPFMRTTISYFGCICNGTFWIDLVYPLSDADELLEHETIQQLDGFILIARSVLLVAIYLGFQPPLQVMGTNFDQFFLLQLTEELWASAPTASNQIASHMDVQLFIPFVHLYPPSNVAQQMGRQTDRQTE
jgi:hypothetical protein